MPFYGSEHPMTLSPLPTVVLSVKIFGFVNFNNNWSTIIMEATKLLWVGLQVLLAYFPYEVAPINQVMLVFCQ